MYEWSKPVIEESNKRGIKVDCIDGSCVIKSEIISKAEKLNPCFIFLNGHGDSENFYGYEGETVIGMDDAGIFEDRIVFSRACDCANRMGKEAVARHGCKSFIGYKYEFVNVRQTNTEIHPRRDKVSRPIWETSNAVPIGLIKGSTVSESVESSRRKTTKEMSKLIFSKEPGAIETLKALIINDEGLIFHGDASARIKE